ncbi:hypothetical protein DAETH_37960 (plasmid) [Deinococcus aetherius]|uniref:Nuclear transport factor 2 family protein n=1 Tax=Deinococcus aetherius TaxID=200252 RepID=A0ABN6RKG4_9DEIO|nr:hypothetical protein [Deinococcus aetherius]BDP43827.1 hypothetical protein DAETH_37960 [Deinococcus aetherius]
MKKPLAITLAALLAPTAFGQPAPSSARVSVPAPVQCYVNAVNRNNLNALVSCFASGGVVIDVSRQIRGQEAIRTWARNEVMGGTLRVLSATPRPNGVRLLVHWAPRGSQGWRAAYTFTYWNGKLTRADLQYA